MIPLALVDDEVLFRKGLGTLIAGFEEVEVVLEASDGQEFLDLLPEADPLPEMVLLDLNMPKLNGLDTSKILQEKYPELKIIILSTYFSEHFILNMIQIGASAYLPKDSLPQEVEHTLREVAEKGFAYNDQVLQVIRKNMTKRVKPKPSFGPAISEREQEVLQLICEQYTTGEIAERLFISPRTVDGHRNNLLQKLNCRNTAGLVVYAVQQGMVKISPDAFWK